MLDRRSKADEMGDASQAAPRMTVHAEDRTPEQPRDLRRYASQTNLRLALGMSLLLLTVGNGLVYWIYGPGALLTSLSCILSFALPVGLIAVLLWVLGWISRRAQDE